MELRATAFPDLFNVVDENGKGFAHVMKAKDDAAEVGAMWSAWLWLPDGDEPMGTAGSAVTAMLLVNTKRERNGGATMTNKLDVLMAEATRTKAKAHEAYTLALQAGESRAAFDTLMHANQVVRIIYGMQIRAIVDERAY